MSVNFDELKRTVSGKIEDAKNDQRDLERLLDDIKELERQVEKQAEEMTKG